MIKASREKFEGRIAEAFTLCPPSVEIETLLSDVAAATKEIDIDMALVRERALDPTIIGTDAHAARNELNDLAFRLDRLQEAERRLRDLLQVAKDSERQAKRQEEYDLARKERDDLATELAEVYPRMSEKLAELARRIRASDERIERLNHRALPNGASYLQPVELVARGLRGFNDGPQSVPRIASELRLPSFRYSAHARYL